MTLQALAPAPQQPVFRAATAFKPEAPAPSDSFTPSENQPPQLNPRELGETQFADSHGRVTHLALMMSSYARGATRTQMLDAYKTLFTRMEPDTRFTIAVESVRDRKDVERVIQEANVENPERIQFVDPKAGSLTVWARDMMVPLHLKDDPNHVALLEQTPLHDWHDNDSKVPAAICAQNPQILLDVDKSLVTDGGDVMANTKESLVGYYSLSATAEKLAKKVEADPAAKAALVAEFEQKTGRHVVDAERPVSFSFQRVERPEAQENDALLPWRLAENPSYEAKRLGPNQARLDEVYETKAVDMFASKFGKPVTLMGKDDPTTTHREEPASDHLDMGCTPVDDNTFFVGDPGLAKQLIGKMTPEELADAERKLSEAAGTRVRLPRPGDRNRDNQEDFDAYERKLKEKGYNVLRLPHSEPKGWTGGSYISYNNCLMERFEKDGQEVRRVFLPVYNIPKFDEYATKAWEGQGFEVIPMPLGALSARWGALRCVSNWLERSPQA